MGPKKAAKKPVKQQEEQPLKLEIFSSVTLPNGLVLYDLTSPTFEKDLLLQQKEHVDNFNEKKAKEELDIDRKRRDIRMKLKEFSASKPSTKSYEPLEPVKKSDKLKELERSIRRGTFFGDHKKYLSEEYPQQFYWNRRPEYRNTFDSVGIMRHRIWKPVY